MRTSKTVLNASLLLLGFIFVGEASAVGCADGSPLQPTDYFGQTFCDAHFASHGSQMGIQEFWEGSNTAGAIKDYKCGSDGNGTNSSHAAYCQATDSHGRQKGLVDKTGQVGTYAISGTTVTLTYTGGSAVPITLHSDGLGGILFCDGNGDPIKTVSVVSGTGGCGSN
jgi:hypothetical protein